MVYCKICGEWNCEDHEQKLHIAWKREIHGSTPPEIFVGKWNYPNVYAGIVAPEQSGETQIFSSPEEWHKNQLSIKQITELRNKLIYGRKQQHIKQVQSPFIQVLKEVAMTHKSVSTELLLKKPIQSNKENDASTPLITKAATLESARLEENAPVKPKIDSIVNEDIRATTAILELTHNGISSETLTKLLSAGLLGNNFRRKMVPTKWAITAVDDTISKKNLEKIRTFPVISEYYLFNATYLGNHYEFILFPQSYAFEVIEYSLALERAWQDYESIIPRKDYADSVTGAYYANRLALTEYLIKIKKQASCLVLREIRPEYNAPCGVGILRQVSREAFLKKPEVYSSFAEIKGAIQKRLQIPLSTFTEKSWLISTPRQSQLTSFL